MKSGRILWDERKNDWLKLNRSLSFELAAAAIHEGRVIDDFVHPSRPNQRMMIVELNGYVCAVPYILEGGDVFLKTIYPNREMKAKYGSKK